LVDEGGGKKNQRKKKKLKTRQGTEKEKVFSKGAVGLKKWQVGKNIKAPPIPKQKGNLRTTGAASKERSDNQRVERGEETTRGPLRCSGKIPGGSREKEIRKSQRGKVQNCMPMGGWV